MAATLDFFETWQSYSVGILPTTVWTSDDYRNMPQILDSSTDGVKGPMTGNRMLRLNRNALLAWNDAARFESCRSPVVNYTNEIFYRWWLRPDQNHNGDGEHGAKYLRFFITGGGAEWIDFFSNYHNGGSSAGLGNSGVMGDDQTTYWGDDPNDDSERTSDYSKVELYINTTTGVYKCWNNNILNQNISGRNFAGLKATQVYLASNDALADSNPNPPPSPDATNHWYFGDILVFSDSGTGQATTGSMSDASIEVSGNGGGGESEGGAAPPSARRMIGLTRIR